MYKVEIKSYFEELYRYNIMALLAGFNEQGEQSYTVGNELIYSEEINFDFDAVVDPPEGFTLGEPLMLQGESAASIQLLVYVITTTLPEDRSSVSDARPFDLMVTIERDDEVVYEESHEVNQWGGVTINIKL